MTEKTEKTFLESLRESHDAEYWGDFYREPRWKWATRNKVLESEPELPKCAKSGHS